MQEYVTASIEPATEAQATAPFPSVRPAVQRSLDAMKNIVGAYGIAVNYSTGSASKNPFTRFPPELIDSSVDTD
eukprot:4077258-Lingulodinium_polyedra.AAC.1